MSENYLLLFDICVVDQGRVVVVVVAGIEEDQHQSVSILYTLQPPLLSQ